MLLLTAPAPPAERPLAAATGVAQPGARAGRDRPLRVLVFTSLFPSEARPRHGIFVETRLANLIKDCPVDARVVAPVPWFPFTSPRFGSYAKLAATPRHAARPNGLQVTHPRYPMLPKVGVAWQPDAMVCGALSDVEQLWQSGWQPDLIDAHYLYPDGVAAARLARRLNVPFVMTARGTDVNVLASLRGPGQRISEAAAQSEAIITVSQSLKARLLDLGVDATKITVLRNGVDLDVFGVTDRLDARAHLGLPASGRLLVCVGNLVLEKGHELALQCLRLLPGYQLLIVGDGPRRAPLAALAQEMGVGGRVVFRPALPQRELRHVYSSADALLLTSTREGWPNVVLEAIACGTPVVACDVGAVREIIHHAQMGRVVAGRDAAALAAAVEELLSGSMDPAEICAHAAVYDWTSISRGQYDLFLRVLARVGDRDARVA